MTEQKDPKPARLNASAPADLPRKQRVLTLKQGHAERHYWADLWNYRELFGILAWRDVAVQYKQTIIGIAWAVVRPLMTMVIFTVVFGRIAQLPSEGQAPYPLMVMCGMLAWYLFSTVFSKVSESLITNANLISKVYFPRLIVPFASSIVALVDFGVSLFLLFGMMLLYGFLPDWRILFLPAFMLLAVLSSLGPALMLCAFNVRYRDFRFIVPFIVQFGLFVSPVGFSSSVVPEEWRLLYSLNPVVGVIDGFRWALLGGEAELNLPGIVISCVVVVFFLIVGVRTFRATERTFADLI